MDTWICERALKDNNTDILFTAAEKGKKALQRRERKSAARRALQCTCLESRCDNATGVNALRLSNPLKKGLKSLMLASAHLQPDSILFCLHAHLCCTNT